MDIQTNPTSHSHSGGVVRKRSEQVWKWTVVMDGVVKKSKESSPSPSIKNCGFTWAQLKELEHQTIIFRHIVAGLPVPFHLVLPIRKTLPPPPPPTLAKYPIPTYSVIGLGPQAFDKRNTMDVTRCRRTDGKKWRCRKNVVPDQKYCVQHMHRGRQRSRKLVEDAQVASSRLPTRIPDIPKGESDPGIPVSVGLQLMTTSSSNVSHGSTTTPICSFSKKWIATDVTAPYITTNNAATATTVLVSNKSNQNVGRDDSDECFRNNCIIGRSNNINGGRNISPGLDFSPKSVVHFQGRCRRTDGKKWRCRRDVIPGEKYCARHMHRGAKKLVKVFPSATTTAMHPAPLHPTMVVSGRIDRVSPNTKLSISIPASSPPSNDGEESNSSTSSDTTISDRSITD